MAKLEVTITGARIDHEKGDVVFEGTFTHRVSSKKIDKEIAKRIASRNKSKDVQTVGEPS